MQKRFSEPMPWIGMYIAIASFFCILAMVADLLHGLRNRKLWFPCKYFTLNAASLTVIAVAMKLPMDLNNLMPDFVDQASKLVSMGFMCTMMSNLLPSLATMDSKELASNIIALGVLIITLVVNVCIQMKTGVLFFHGDHFAHYLNIDDPPETFLVDSYLRLHRFTATIYVGLLPMLLIIYVSSSVAILKSKQILEAEYQAAHEKTLKDQELKQPSVGKLKQHVSNYWIMAETGSPQFIAASSPLSSASGVICGLSTLLQIVMMFPMMQNLSAYKSDYKWSMEVIVIIQFIGVIVGTIAPLSRCFAALRFKLSVNWIWNHIRVVKVESYWNQKLYDWKQGGIPSPFSSRKCKIAIHKLQILILGICIGFQKAVVVACKMIAVIPIFFVICVLYGFRCWKWLKGMVSAPGIVLGQNPEQIGKDKDLSMYVLQLQDEMEFPERTLKRIQKSVNRLIEKAEKQPNNLMKLLEKSRGFGGVEKFNDHRVPSLLLKEHLNCWSLTLVTLTTIAISLPNIRKNVVDCLLNGVSEGLAYVTLVEESLNAINDHVSVQKAAKALWLEVEVHNTWLGNKLPNLAPHANTAIEILQWLSNSAKNIVSDLEIIDIGNRIDESMCKSISANSMYRITETTLLSYNIDIGIDPDSQEELFSHLSSVIADILAACLTNLPQVIAMKCHASVIEKREASVHDAAQLLGETVEIINKLKDCQLPSLNPDELAYIEKVACLCNASHSLESFMFFR